MILASSLIPGNENPVNRVINGLTRWGADVVHKGNALVHVSGHASAGELLYFYNLLTPANVMPVHGEPRHLRANGALAVRTGVPADRVLIAEDGVVVDLVDGRASIVGAVPCGHVYVDGSSVGDITEASLKDRRILGEEGFISVFVVVDLDSSLVVAGPGAARPRLRRGRRDLPRRPAPGHPRAGGGACPRRHRRVRPRAGRAPPGRALGELHAPTAADDRPGGRRGLSGRRPPTAGRRLGRRTTRTAGGLGDTLGEAPPPVASRHGHQVACARPHVECLTQLPGRQPQGLDPIRPAPGRHVALGPAHRSQAVRAPPAGSRRPVRCGRSGVAWPASGSSSRPSSAASRVRWDAVPATSMPRTAATGSGCSCSP